MVGLEKLAKLFFSFFFFKIGLVSFEIKKKKMSNSVLPPSIEANC